MFYAKEIKKFPFYYTILINDCLDIDKLDIKIKKIDYNTLIIEESGDINYSLIIASDLIKNKELKNLSAEDRYSNIISNKNNYINKKLKIEKKFINIDTIEFTLVQPYQ